MMDFSTFKTLRVHEESGFVSVMLNRPEVRNAMSQAMVYELTGLAEWLSTQSEIRGVILRGSEGHFCAGGDVTDMAQARAKVSHLQPK